MKSQGMEDELYTISDVCKVLNLSRYQVNRLLGHGLVRYIKRCKNGYRVLNKQQLNQLEAFYYLSRCGMKTKELKAYSRLAYSDRNTITERKAILETKKRQIWENLKDLQENIDFIERQVELLENS